MKTIQLFSLAAIAAVLTSTASAFPYANPTYTVGPLNAAEIPPSPKGGSTATADAYKATTIAVYPQARSVTKKAHAKSHQ